MKRIMKMILSLGLGIALTGAAISGVAASAAPALAASASTSVSAVGNAEITADPDIAYVTLGVRVTKSTVKSAQDENTKLMNAVINSAKKAGVEEKDIQTNNISVYPSYDYSSSAQKVIGYDVSNSVSITIRDLDKVGSIVDGALAAGANTVNGLIFDLEDKDPVYNKALAQATKKASSKAKVMAEAAGLKVGGIESIIESGASVQMNRAGSSYYYDVVVDEATSSSFGGSIQAGQVTVSANVTVTYSAS